MASWSLERWLLICTLACSALAFTFGIGAKWRGVPDEAAIAQAFARVEQTYVRADVYAADRQRFTESIDRLNRNLERIEAVHYAPTAPAPDSRTPGRVFDR